MCRGGEARSRILQRLGETPGGRPLNTLLPEADVATRSVLRQRSAWSGTLIASLELAKQGDVMFGAGRELSAHSRRSGVTVSDRSWLSRRHGINAEFLADMSEFLRIGEAAVAHHRAECREARLGEDQPRQALAGVEPHQSTVQKPLGDGGDLRLAGVRAAAPGLELEALSHARQRREEDIQFAADISSLARREPGDLCSVRLGHGLDARTSGLPGPKPSTTRDVAVVPIVSPPVTPAVRGHLWQDRRCRGG